MNQFKKVNDFSEILGMAEEKVNESATNYIINFELKVQFDVCLTRESQLPYATKLAEEWQSIERPKNLHINHGEYIGKEGIGHVIEELKNKKDSNRAVISLISQEHIIKSGDKPIPSFMILQFGLENNELYVVAYFRALEVHNFLPINLEEIRLIIHKLTLELTNISTVNLNILAFRAYLNSNQSTLTRFELDIKRIDKILYYMETRPKDIIRLLREKLEESTVTESCGFRNMLEIIEDPDYENKINKCFTQPLIIKCLKDCIDKTDELSKLRAKTSHNQYIKEINQTIKYNLEQIIKELEKCL